MAVVVEDDVGRNLQPVSQEVREIAWMLEIWRVSTKASPSMSSVGGGTGCREMGLS